MVADCRRYFTAATLIAIAALSLSGCDEPTPPSVPDLITISPASASLASIDGTARLTATVFDQHGEEMPDEPLSWKSPDPAVATVDARGTVTAKGNGTVAVEVSAGSAQATAAVTVRQVPVEIDVDPSADTLTAIGDTLQIVAVAKDANGHATGHVDFEWTSENDTVATVDSTGLVAAVGNGVTRVSVETAGLAASVAVTVSQAAAAVAVSPAADSVLLRDTTRLEAVVADANGHVIVNPVLEWVARNASVAEVDDAGLVTGVGEGTSTVAARSEGVEGAAEITVVNPDRAVLVGFYEATDGPNWTSNSNWLTDRPLDEWHGVGTDADDRVDTLNLGNNSLAGELPPELGDLSSLKYLSLEYNSLTGEIPPELGDLSNLEHLHLDNSSITGEIPSELGGLSSLVHLRLNHTPITGEIPPELGDLSNLIMLELRDTELTGEIPPELGDLSNLELLDLHYNSLTGEIPRDFLDLSSLVSFLWGDNEGLCVPDTSEFDDWLDGLEYWSGPRCD